MKDSLIEATEQVLPVDRRRGNQPWMTEAILLLMDERRQQKGRGNLERYKELDDEVKRRCWERKEQWLNQRCEEVEQLEKIDTHLMHKKIKEMTGIRKPTRSSVIKDRDGNLLMDQTDVLQRWEEYIGELFDDDRREEHDSLPGDTGPSIIRAEVERAIAGMAGGKAAGEDGVVAEMIQAGGEVVVEKILEVSNRIYDTGYIPEAMRKSLFIAIPKRDGAVECEKHRTISIMSQIGKVLLRVIRERIKRKIEESLTEEQYGFRRGKGTNNAIFALRVMLERSVEMQKDIYLCFVDFEKAFDTVRHEDMIDILRGIGLDDKDVRIIEKLYWDQEAAVKIGQERTAWVKIKRGVRQGCILSPDIFSVYSQIILQELEDLEGMRIGGRNINNIRYADDTVLVADSPEKLQLLINALEVAGLEKGIKINFGKTKTMGITKKRQRLVVDVSLQQRRIEQVDKFTYLGSSITEDVECGTEIIKRIGIAKKAFSNMRSILTNMSIRMDTRRRILKGYIWSTMLYGCESWTMRKRERKRLEAAEMWFWRRMLRISWIDRVTNEEVLRRAGVERELLKFVRRRQLRFLGHVLRAEELENDCLLGRVEGSRARGRQRITYMKSLLEYIAGGMTVADLVIMARDRERWRSMIANVT